MVLFRRRAVYCVKGFRTSTARAKLSPRFPECDEALKAHSGALGLVTLLFPPTLVRQAVKRTRACLHLVAKAEQQVCGSQDHLWSTACPADVNLREAGILKRHQKETVPFCAPWAISRNFSFVANQSFPICASIHCSRCYCLS